MEVLTKVSFDALEPRQNYEDLCNVLSFMHILESMRPLILTRLSCVKINLGAECDVTLLKTGHEKHATCNRAIRSPTVRLSMDERTPSPKSEIACTYPASRDPLTCCY